MRERRIYVVLSSLSEKRSVCRMNMYTFIFILTSHVDLLVHPALLQIEGMAVMIGRSK